MASKKELKYRIEALEDEIEYLKETLRDKHEKLWKVIQENDRLTLTYEPYRPPGDKNEELTFYGLLEENENLAQNILDKMEVIKEVEKENMRLLENNKRLTSELIDVRKAVAEMKIAKENKPLIKYERWWNVSFELWPGAWGLNYYRYQWNKYGSDSREGSIQLGPLGFSWNREPKKRG